MAQRRESDGDLEIIGDHEPANIVICEYDPRWPARFASVRDRIRAALGGRALGIEHIGSTSVPGLAAKPIVDVLLTVADVDDETAYLPALQEAGFLLRAREPGHRLLRPPEKNVHLHVWSFNDPEVPAYLDLRDWLRQSPADQALYARTKRELATRPWKETGDYANAKSEVIAQILGRARSWRAASPSDTR